MKRKGLSLGDPATRRILAAVREAAVLWFQDELARPDSMLAINPMTDEEREKVAVLADELPEDGGFIV